MKDKDMFLEVFAINLLRMSRYVNRGDLLTPRGVESKCDVSTSLAQFYALWILKGRLNPLCRQIVLLRRTPEALKSRATSHVPLSDLMFHPRLGASVLRKCGGSSLLAFFSMSNHSFPILCCRHWLLINGTYSNMTFD